MNKNRQQVMEEIYREHGKSTSVGTLVLALSQKFPAHVKTWQKNGSHFEIAIAFLREKREQYNWEMTKEKGKQREFFQDMRNLFLDLTRAFRGLNYEIIIPQQTNIVSLADAFKKV